MAGCSKPKGKGEKIVGVLALQGAFREHLRILESLGVKGLEIRTSRDLEMVDGIILPGGESTTMGKLLHDFGIMERLRERIESGLPVWGTCAGMILLADRIHGDDTRHVGTMDIEVVRNGYGRQLGSFMTEGRFQGIGKKVPMAFIRAPYIESVGENVEVLSEVDGKIVAAREKNMLSTAFHPELTEDSRIHQYFIGMIS